MFTVYISTYTPCLISTFRKTVSGSTLSYISASELAVVKWYRMVHMNVNGWQLFALATKNLRDSVCTHAWHVTRLQCTSGLSLAGDDVINHVSARHVIKFSTSAAVYQVCAAGGVQVARDLCAIACWCRSDEACCSYCSS